MKDAIDLNSQVEHYKTKEVLINNMNSTLRRNIFLYPPIDGYNQLAKYYTQSKWFCFWNDNEMPIVRSYINEIRPKSVLDAGCGTSVYLDLIIRCGARYTGIDISEGMLKQARIDNSHLLAQYKERISFYQASIEEFSAPEKFDTMICTRVLSHNRYYDRIIENFHNNLTPGGYLILSDVHPMHNYQHSRFQTPKGKVNIDTYKHPMSELKKMLGKYGFVIRKFGEYNLSTILHKPTNVLAFEKLYAHPANKIFYTLLAQKKS